MDTKIDVLGMEIDCLYAGEIMEKMNTHWEEGGLYTYGVITMNLLMEAQEEPILRRYVEELDMSIIGEPEVLQAAGIMDEVMNEEIISHEFLRALLVFLAEFQNPVFILGETEEEAKMFASYLQERFVRLPIVGVDYLDSLEADGIDRVINEINSLSPEAVITCSGGFALDRFSAEHRKKINTRFWLNVGNHPQVAGEMGAKSGFLSKLMEKTAFRKLVNRYNSEKGD